MIEQNKLAYYNMIQKSTRWVNPNTNSDILIDNLIIYLKIC